MSTTTEAVRRLAETSGISPDAIGRLVRALREATPDRLWPASGRGGGKSALHVDVHPLAYFVMGLAASQPSDAVDTVKDLSEYRTENLLEGSNLLSTLPSGASWVSARLDVSIKQLIHYYSDKRAREVAQLSLDRIRGENRAPNSFYISVDAGSVSYLDTANFTRFEWTRPTLRPGPRVGRMTSIPLEVLLTAGEIWEDTQNHLRSLPFSDSLPASDPETENAAPARAALSNQPRSRASSLTNHKENKRETETDQGSRPLAAGIPRSQGRKTSHVRSNPFDACAA